MNRFRSNLTMVLLATAVFWLMPSLFVAQGAPPKSESKLDIIVEDFSAIGDDIQEILGLLGADLGLQFSVSPKVKGTVNASFQKVSLRAILDAILTPLEATYIEEGGIIKIMHNSERTQESQPTETRTFRLNNRKVGDVKEMIEPYRSKEGTITVDPETNSITVTDFPPKLAEIADQIRIIDGQELVTRVFEIENAVLQEVVDRLTEMLNGEPEIIADERLSMITIKSNQANIDLAEQIIEIMDRELPLAVFSFNFLKREEISDIIDIIQTFIGEDLKKLSYHESTRRLIVEAPENKIKKIKQIIEAFDVQTKQVFIECEILDVGDNDDFQFSIDFTAGKDTGKMTTVVSGTDESDVPSMTNLLGGVGDLLRFGGTGADFFRLSPENYAVTIKALKSRSDTTVLASPRLFVRDNGTASINDGGTEPMANVSNYNNYNNNNNTNNNYGNQNQYSQRDREVGIILELDEVHIADNGYVELIVHLEDSQADPNRVDLGGGLTGLRTTQTTIDTELVLKNNHTAVMGGVIRRHKSVTRSGIPILSEIPIIGLLFRDTSVLEEKSKLLLFITPHVRSVEDPFDMTYADSEMLFEFFQDQKLVDWRDEDERAAEAEERQKMIDAGIDPDADKPAPGEPVTTGNRTAIPVSLDPHSATGETAPEVKTLKDAHGGKPKTKVSESDKKAKAKMSVWDCGYQLAGFPDSNHATLMDDRGRKFKTKLGAKVNKNIVLLALDKTKGYVILQNQKTGQEVRLQTSGQRPQAGSR
jgi:general secretion pathway protein D